MKQSRTKIGQDFEKKILAARGLTKSTAKPRIAWSVDGTTLDRLLSTDLNPNRFQIVRGSKCQKYDAVKENGDKVEIKNYHRADLRSWRLYSEPTFKIASHDSFEELVEHHSGRIGPAITAYNRFTRVLFAKIKKTNILKRITSSNIGIECIDGFIPNRQLEFRWKLIPNWKGLNRISIQVRLKSNVLS
jgi:hypothetical protein